MPVKLYLKIMKIFTDYYWGKNLGSELAIDITNALMPICKAIEEGEYDMDKDKR